MRCILHIGTEKTGTTTLQRLLRKNQDGLANHGVFVPTSFGHLEHHHVVSYGIRAGRFFSPLSRAGVTRKEEMRSFRIELRRKFEDELRNVPPDSTVVLSSERCFGVLRDQGEIERLTNMLAEYFDEVKVVVYLRPQHELLVSLYSTALKNGFVHEDILPKDISAMPHLDYNATMQRWVEAVGAPNTHIAIFDRSKLVQGDIGADFFSQILDLDIADFETVENENESLSVEGQLFLRTINGFLPRFEKKELSQKRGDIGKRVGEVAAGRGMLPTQEEALTFYEQFAASNEELRAEWFPDQESLFDLNLSKYPSTKIDYQLPQEEAFRIFGELWTAKHGEISKLRNQRKSKDRGAPEVIRTDASMMNERYSSAEEALAGDRPEGAIGLLEANLESSPRAAQSMYLLGIALCALGRISAGRSAIDRALDLKPWVRDPASDIIDLYDLAVSALEHEPSWPWAQYQRRLRRVKTIGLELGAAAQALPSRKATVVQVGANDGVTNDPIRELIANSQWSGVLLEPQPGPFSLLEDLYSDRSDIALENAALADTDGVVTLHAETSPASTFASMRPPAAVTRKKSSTLEPIEVRSITVDTLLRKHQIEKVDVLQVCTDGYDAEIVALFGAAERGVSIVNVQFHYLDVVERLQVLDELGHLYAWKFDGQNLLAIRRNDTVDERFTVSVIQDKT